MSGPPPPPGINLSESQQSHIIGAIISTWALAVIAVGLRFVSRRMAKSGYWWDDWLIIPPLIFATILCFISTIWMIHFGLGKHIWVAPDGAVPVFLKGIFISELTFTGVLVFVKYSILALYWRLFPIRPVKIAVYVVGTFVTCWGVAVLITTLAQCIPLNGFWDKTIQSTCGVNDYRFFFGNSIPNIVTDIVLLTLPMRPVWRLHITKSQKISLTIVFILGGFVTATSITRLVYLVNLDLTSIDVTWNFGAAQIWTCVEMNIAIVSGCLPSLRPLLSLILTGSSKRPSSHRKISRNSYDYTTWGTARGLSSAAVRGGVKPLSESNENDGQFTEVLKHERDSSGRQKGSIAGRLTTIRTQELHPQ